MESRWFFCTSLFLFAIFSEQKNVKENQMLYKRNGNISIIGVFSSFSGNDCSIEVTKGLEETASAIWTVEALNSFHYLPGVTIGLSIFDACHYLNQQKKLARMMEDAQLTENSINIGILTSQEVYVKLENFEGPSSKIMQLNHIISPQLLVHLTLQLLLNLQWMTVRAVVSDNQDILNLFKDEYSKERIQVLDYVLVNERGLNLHLNAEGDVETPSVIVVIAASNSISNIGEKMSNGDSKLIIMPTDFTFDSRGFPNDTIVLLPSMESKNVLFKYIKSTARYKNFFSHKGPTKSPLFIGTAVNILKLLKPVKKLLSDHCEDAMHPCTKGINLLRELIDNKSSIEVPKPTKISPDDILETLNVLKIEPSFNDEMFLYIASVLNPNASEDFSIFKIFSIQTKKFGPVLLKINDNLVRNRNILIKPESGMKYVGQMFEETKEFTNSLIRLSQNFPSEGNFPMENVGNVNLTETTDCDDDECKNFERGPKSPNQNTGALGWRFLTWVCVNTALAFTGVTCTLSVILFIFIRFFKGDPLGSSICFNLLLMLSVILMYCSSLVFHVEYIADSSLLCLFRVNAPPVVCAILFSLLLSRSLMLAFSDNSSEFGSHINGYLHSILCILMISLQASITIQNRNFGTDDGNCSEVHDRYKLIIALSYDFFLLIFLACVSPFIICSKRNNKEGFLISVSVFFITVVWSTWICFYILLSTKYRDAAVAIGLNSTATVIVFCIFIPRVYFMTVSTVQDSTICYIPTLGKLADGLNINSQSSQTLHDSTVGIIRYKNGELGSSNPNFHTIRPEEDNRVGVRESVIDLSSEPGQSK